MLDGRQALNAAQASQAVRAQHLMRQGDAAGALALARALTGAAPQAADAWQLLALCAAEAGDAAAAEAEAAFVQAARLAPAEPAILTNHAQFLRRQRRFGDAIARLRMALALRPDFQPARRGLGLALLDAGQPEAARDALLQLVAAEPGDATAWHALGNAHRQLDALEAAESAFARATTLAPGSASAWLNLGAVQRLLGRPAQALEAYRHAQRQGYRGPELPHAMAGALVDNGDPQRAIAVTRELLRTWTGFVPAHVTLAQLRWEYEAGEDGAEQAVDELRAAADAQPGNPAMQLARIAFLLEIGRAGDALAAVQACMRVQEQPILVALEATALDALGETARASQGFERVCQSPELAGAALLNAYARHLLRIGEAGHAARRAQQATALEPFNQEAWSYLGTAWRLVGDPREDWLMDYERSIGMVAIEPPEGWQDMGSFLADLEAVLTPLHRAYRAPIRQSLRTGSQTPGQLFGRDEPVLRAARGALQAAVAGWVARLPVDERHPFYARTAAQVRISGSWSVRLRSSGRHVNHVHPGGWMSSAFYVSLPPSIGSDGAGGDSAGFIQFGQPPEELGLQLQPRRVLQPRPGHLALFPSYMWHGTVPFQDEVPRLTMAFDMLPVRDR